MTQMPQCIQGLKKSLVMASTMTVMAQRLAMQMQMAMAMPMQVGPQSFPKTQTVMTKGKQRQMHPKMTVMIPLPWHGPVAQKSPAMVSTKIVMVQTFATQTSMVTATVHRLAAP